MAMRPFVARICLAIVLAACQAVPLTAGPTASPGRTAPGLAPTASPTAAPTADRVAGWRSDLAALVPGMDRLHPDLGHGTPVSELEQAAAALAATVPAATDDELMVGITRIVARVSANGCDAHTGAYFWGGGASPVDSLPLRLWWFDEGLFVVDALEPYRSLVGARIDAIDGHRTADVLAMIEPIVPRDNEATVRLLMPRFVLIPQVLRGLGLVGAGPLDLETTGPDGRIATTSVEPLPMSRYNAWAGPYGLHLPIDPNVPYLSRIGDALWWQLLPDNASTLFVQYNRVDQLRAADLSMLQAALDDPGVDRVVLDIRHNYGGEVSALTSPLERFERWAAARPGRLFLVTGRNTFSAASLFAARLTATEDVVVSGEAMGGCPTAYGNSRDLRLSYSGIIVSVAGTLEVGVAPDDPRRTIEPDLPTPLTPEAWAAGLDPALAAIAAEGP